MTKTYYDDFTKLHLSKMAQAMSDITYGYEETQVPKEHYKKAPSADYEEIVSANVSVKLVETIYNMLNGLQKASPDCSTKRLYCLIWALRPSTMSAQQYQALSLVSDDFEQNKKARMLNAQTYEDFNDVLLNGTTYHFNN